MRRLTSRIPVGVFGLGLMVACSDVNAVDVTSEPSGSSSDTSVVEDAAVEDAEATSTSSDIQSTESSSSAPEAGVIAVDAGADGGESSSDVVESDAGQVDGGDAGGVECTADSDGPNDNPDCTERAENDWCGSDDAAGACMMMAYSRDEGVYVAFKDCLTEALDATNACDSDLGVKIGECIALADAQACVVPLDACSAYEGCRSTTVQDCYEQVAPFNQQWIAYGSSYFACGIQPRETME